MSKKSEEYIEDELMSIVKIRQSIFYDYYVLATYQTDEIALKRLTRKIKACDTLFQKEKKDLLKQIERQRKSRRDCVFL